MNPILIASVAFITAFIFGLGGLGSAAALIPILVFLGIPFPIARSAGLFTNFVSTTSITVHNLSHRNIDFKLAVPMVITSTLFAPIGAYVSFLVPERVVGLTFVAFLLFAGTTVFLPKRKETYKRSCPIYVPLLIGAISGFVAGMLGVGGGALRSPMLLLYGIDPKVVSSAVALSVVFGSFTSFITYWKLGGVDWTVLLSVAIPALFAGYSASYVTHRYLKPYHVKRILGVIFYLLAIKFAMKFV